MADKVASFLLALWLGAAIFFSGVVAPTAFRVLRNFALANAGEIAGTIVSYSLSLINLSGVVVSVVALILAVGFGRHYSTLRRAVLAILLLIITITTAAGEWIIAARMRALRAQMLMPIDQVPLTDPHRIMFGTLHGFSVAALGIAIIAGLISCFVLGNRKAPS